MDGGADVRVAGEMPASELGPGEERLIVGGVRQVGHDPPDAEPARAQRNGCRIPVPYGCINPLMGQSLSAKVLPIRFLHCPYFLCRKLGKSENQSPALRVCLK